MIISILPQNVFPRIKQIFPQLLNLTRKQLYTFAKGYCLACGKKFYVSSQACGHIRHLKVFFVFCFLKPSLAQHQLIIQFVNITGVLHQTKSNVLLGGPDLNVIPRNRNQDLCF